MNQSPEQLRETIHTLQRETGRGVRRICETLRVPRRSYCHAATARARSDRELGEMVERTFRENRRRYGYRQIRWEMCAQGHSCPPERVRRLMAERGLHALQPRSYVPRTSDGRAPSPGIRWSLSDTHDACPGLGAGAVLMATAGKIGVLNPSLNAASCVRPDRVRRGA